MFQAEARRIPVATYRLQLRREFPLDAAAALVAYAKGLGISDYYCSPIFFSTPGSTHGYDVNDYRRIDPELGGPEGLGRLHAQLRAHDMGLLLDFVPNHMGINGPGLLNTWWRDVLENGERSRHAHFFDIDWNNGGKSGRAQVLVPILDNHYGRVLEEGRLALRYERGALSIAYGEMRFPVRRETYEMILAPLVGTGEEGNEIDALARAFGQPRHVVESEDDDAARRRRAELTVLKQKLGALLERRPSFRKSFDERLRLLNGTPAHAESFDGLDAVIEQQHYRLAYWKSGVHETNYRRFFAIDTLIGLRMEIPEVFHECHALLARLVQEGIVTGLRIDHVDGLRDPKQYLDRLQAIATREGGEPTLPFYVVVEKILAENESLPVAWSTHGTTGYEFIEQLAGLFVDARTARHFTEIYGGFGGETRAFDDIVYEEKQLVLDELFANAVVRLAGSLADILQADRRWRDLTRHELTVAVRELMVAHGVYRTYRHGVEKMDERDRRVVEQACAIAVARNRRFDAAPFELVRDVLTGTYPDDRGGETSENLKYPLADWVLNFQQYTGAVMAKSVEDTAFYTYSRFIALNEVGGNPGRFGGTVAVFHAANQARLRQTPHGFLATSTHDTKLGEDARARLYALSEIPHEWREWLDEWRELNRRHKTTIEGRTAPDADEEYRLYQVLLGAWPADDAEPDDFFRERIREHLRKAVNEAKRNTSWLHSNDAWLEAGDRFVDAILGNQTAHEFLVSFRRSARRVAHLGLANSLAQVVLKCTSPGVPDFYQGSELWDFSLVDPDNRRLVDFARREAMAARPADERGWGELLHHWQDGEIKLQVTRALLRFRADHAALFQHGGYRAVETKGLLAENVCAFTREFGEEAVVVVVPRLTSKLGSPPLGLVWDDTTVVLPAEAHAWRDIVTGRARGGAAEISVADLFAELPFAVMAG